MSIYGECIHHVGREATHAVVYKDGRFRPANDRFGADQMTVALGDIVFCEECAAAVSALANDAPAIIGPRCDTCGGPASFEVGGNDSGMKCVGHIEKYRRGRAATFYRVESVI